MRRFAIKSCTWSVSCPVLLSKMGAMRHQKLVGIEVEPLYCKVYDPLPHGTSRLSRFRFGQSVPTPFLCGSHKEAFDILDGFLIASCTANSNFILATPNRSSITVLQINNMHNTNVNPRYKTTRRPEQRGSHPKSLLRDRGFRLGFVTTPQGRRGRVCTSQRRFCTT